MEKINFENLPSTNTPISAENLNAMQTNAEKVGNYIGSTQPSTGEKVWYKRGVNLFNKSTIGSGYITAGGGIIAGEHNEATSDFIAIEHGQPYTFSVKNWTSSDGEQMWVAIGLFDANHDFIERIAEMGQTVITATSQKTSNAYYIKVSYRYNDNNILCEVEKGSRIVPKQILTKNNNGIFNYFYDEKSVDNQLSQKVNNFAYPWTDKVDLDIVSGEIALILVNVNLVLVASKGGSSPTAGYGVRVIYTDNTITYTTTEGTNHLTINFSTKVIAKIMK